MNLDEMKAIRAMNLKKTTDGKTIKYADIRFKPDNPRLDKDEIIIWETEEERSRRKADPNRHRNTNSGFHKILSRMREPGEEG